MTKFNQYLKLSYNNWTFPSEATMKMDFSEYKKKEESKWRGRAEMLKARWPLFEDYKHYKNSLKNSKVVVLTDSLLHKTQHATDTGNMDDLRDMVSGYVRPRDLDRIINGFEQGNKIPYPVILKSGQRYFIMSGNTRQNAARILGIKVKVLVVDVGE
jgi:hypothetical protein